MKKTKIKKPIIDWVQFDSDLEWKIYIAFRDKVISNLPWLEELHWYKIDNPRAEWYIILPRMTLWKKKFRALIYTPDFIIKKWKEVIVLEVKSKWTAMKPDYSLRLKLFLSMYWEDVKFAELIQYNQKKYEYIKYF